MKVLVTDATGFVGGAVTRALVHQADVEVVAAVRHLSEDLPVIIKQVLVGNLLADTDYSGVLNGVNVVVHAAQERIFWMMLSLILWLNFVR